MKQASILAGILITATAAFESHGQTTLTNGLMAYYPFSGDANDQSGHGNNGVVRGATLTTDRFGAANRAYYFDGVTNQIVVESSQSLNPPTALTISTWIQTTNAQTQGIFSKWDGGQPDDSVQSYGLLVVNGHPWAHINADNTDDNMREGSVLINDGMWHQVVVTADNATRKIIFYVDGVLDKELGISGNIIRSTTTHVTIGVNEPQFDLHWFKGVIDDIRLYNRAMPAAEVTQLYAAEKTQTNPVPVQVTLLKAMKAVRPRLANLQIDKGYQMQLSTDLLSWTNSGAPFTATGNTMDYPQSWDVDSWDKLFFRVQPIP